MSELQTVQEIRRKAVERGFSIIELLIATTILLAVSGIVLSMMFQMTMTQASISNRTEMHSGVRSVTSLLQQEISQAGRVALPRIPANCDQPGQPPCGTSTLTQAVALLDPDVPETLTRTVASTTGMFNNILLVVGAGGTCANCEEEIVQATVGAGQITATFKESHGVGARIWPSGGFVTGILTTANGGVLKMFGDINDDGQMVYVEYNCNPTADGTGTLTRSQTAWNAVAKGPVDVLLRNLQTNPVDEITGQPVPCFTYQTKAATWTALDGVTVITIPAVVVNVGVTLTARTPFRDAQTNQFQVETKALLTVSPRNVFQAWEMSTMPSAGQHVQPTPAEITTLETL